MAQLQQRVFMIMIRPCFVKQSGSIYYPNTVTKYFGNIYRDILANEIGPTITEWSIPVAGVTTVNTTPLPNGYKLCIKLPALNETVNANPITGGGIERYYDDPKGRMPSNALKFSTPPFNENSWFSNDPWMLHSTWTSFEECKNYVRLLIDLLGFDGVMVSQFIALDLELLPNK